MGREEKGYRLRPGASSTVELAGEMKNSGKEWGVAASKKGGKTRRVWCDRSQWFIVVNVSGQKRLGVRTDSKSSEVGVTSELGKLFWLIREGKA